MTWMEWYNSLAKPSWTPAPSTISLIWMILYPIILISFGFVFVRAFQGKVRWLVAMRKACPNAVFFCIVPPLGVHLSEVQAAVQAQNQAGDHKVHLIDTAPLKQAFRTGQGSTALAYDGVHPSLYGQAMLGALIAVEAQKVISHKD